MRLTLDQAMRELIPTAIDSLPGLFYVVDTDSRLLVWNAEATGYSGDEIARMLAMRVRDP